MGAEAGHDDGNADLAGTVLWGPLVPALFRVTSASHEPVHDGNMLMMGAQPQQTKRNKWNGQRPLPPLISTGQL